MTWAELKADVLVLLTVDKDRIGVTEFIEKQTRAACIDLMQLIERYRSGFKRLYFTSDFTREGFVSRGELPDGARVKEVSIYRTDVATVFDASSTWTANDLVQDPVTTRLYRARQDMGAGIEPGVSAGWADYWEAINTWGALANAIENELALTMHPAVDAAWETRHAAVYQQTSVLDNNARVFISPHGDEFLIYPSIDDAVFDIAATETNFAFVVMEYSSDALDVVDADEVPFDEPAVLAVADWVKGQLARHVDKDLQTFRSFLAKPGDGSRGGGSYFCQRTSLYLRAQEMGRLGE